MIAANSDSSWARLTEAMGLAELMRDARYATHESRGQRMEEVDALVSSWTSTLGFDQLDTALTAAGIPHGLIYRAPDILDDPQYAARGMIQRVHDAVLGRDVPMAGIVPRLTRTPGAIRWTGADVGAHTHQVLGELGYHEDERQALVDTGVIPPERDAR
jgi:crotonobetainyl-CoA:carnitine CoA-transferase CaiB-like acyl-CoA transferase